MKKIIEGKRYDTEKAELVGEWDNSIYDSDFNMVEEVLYRKRTGEFFLHGMGGARTRYAEACGQNAWRGGERIMPMSYEEAQRWAEEHLDADVVEEYFAIPDEDEEAETVPLALSVPAWVKALVAAEAAKSGRTQAEVVTAIVRDALRNGVE